MLSSEKFVGELKVKMTLQGFRAQNQHKVLLGIVMCIYEIAFMSSQSKGKKENNTKSFKIRNHLII